MPRPVVLLAVTVTLLLGLSRAALARDQIVLVCSGIVKPTDDAEQIGVSINYRDSRANDGVSRLTVLRELVGDRVVTWSKVLSVDLDTAVPIVLKAGKRVRFRGTYTLTKRGDDFFMHLAGDVNPYLVDKTTHPIDAEVPCVDISI